MAVEASTLVIAFFAILAGSLGRAAFPFLQERKNKEDEVRALQDIPPDKLTPEEKQLIDNFNKPLNFMKYYKYTALLGVGASVVITLSSLTVATQNIPPGDSITISLGLVPVWLVTGWGGGDISNQLIKSGTSNVQTVKKLVLRALARKGGGEEEEEEFNDSI